MSQEKILHQKSFSHFFKTSIPLLYVIAFVLSYFAKRTFLDIDFGFLWLIYLPIATAAVVTTFDYIMDTFDFEEIKTLKDNNRYLYSLSLAVLSAGFAIATAIFMK
jgi:hypothetical protein